MAGQGATRSTPFGSGLTCGARGHQGFKVTRGAAQNLPGLVLV